MSQQPIDWAKELQEAAKRTEESERLRTELLVRNERMFQSKAPDLREAVFGQIKADCSVLGNRCRIVREESSGLLLEGGEYPLRQVHIGFDLIGHSVKIVKTYSNDGAETHRYGIDAIELRLRQDHICFIGDCGVLSTVQEFSRYAMGYILHRESPQ